MTAIDPSKLTIVPAQEVFGAFTRAALSALVRHPVNDGQADINLAVDTFTMTMEHFLAYLAENKIVLARLDDGD